MFRLFFDLFNPIGLFIKGISASFYKLIALDERMDLLLRKLDVSSLTDRFFKLRILSLELFPSKL